MNDQKRIQNNHHKYYQHAKKNNNYEQNENFNKEIKIIKHNAIDCGAGG